MRVALASLLLPALTLAAQDYSKLPAWARSVVEEASRETPPAGAEAWVLLDRTEVAYTGNGEIRKFRLRVVRVLEQKGAAAAAYAIQGLGGKSSRVKSLKGWNLRPDGELVKLDREDVFTLDSDSGGEISTGLLTGAVLDRVVKGSLIAFESYEIIRHPLGPMDLQMLMERYPVRRWELALAKQGGWFSDLKAVETRLSTRHFEPWLNQVETVPNQSLRIWHVPALPQNEGAAPAWRNVLPQVRVWFIDPAFSAAPDLSTWDSLARWFAGIYEPRTKPRLPEGFQAPAGRPGLDAFVAWMSKELRYRQLYLSPERGWVPEDASEVYRRKLGDCKDLTACLLAGARKLGFEAYPALALIAEGEIEDGDEAGPFQFNHVITAIRLGASLGLASEVMTSKGRFLLVDPTSRATALGRLHPGHLGRKVLVCLPDGAAWAAVPADAVERPSTELLLEGAVEADGRLRGSLVIREDSDHQGLRSASMQGGPDALKSSIRSLLDLPPTGALDVLSAGDPFKADSAFEVKVGLDHPDWMRREGGEWVFSPYGIPGPADLIQKPGEPRRFPVWLKTSAHWAFKADLRLSSAAVPVKEQASVETPLRKASAETKVQGNRLSMHLELERRPARFGFEAREDGVKAQKRDRSQWKLFLEEAAGLKPPSTP